MVNYNGKLIDKLDSDLLNRGFLYGDSVFETIKIVNNRILFWEDHYLRLMSSLRIIRIEIPIFYTPEFFENLQYIDAQKILFLQKHVIFCQTIVYQYKPR